MTTSSDVRDDLSAALAAGIETDSATARWWTKQLQPGARADVALPGLPRRIGRGPLGLERRRVRLTQKIAGSEDRAPSGPALELDVDFGAWRRCDAAAALLLFEATPAQIDDLFAHGDLEERAMVMRSRSVTAIDEATIRLFGEAQRTNTQDHVDAFALDSNLVARAVDAGLPIEDFNRLILKAAFVDMPLARMFGAEAHANSELSAMLQDFATEREAAGRPTWLDTLRMIGRAPAKGTLARLLGALEHGDDAHRLAALDGLGAMAASSPQHAATIRPFLDERLPREPYPPARALLSTLVSRP